MTDPRRGWNTGRRRGGKNSSPCAPPGGVSIQAVAARTAAGLRRLLYAVLSAALAGPVAADSAQGQALTPVPGRPPAPALTLDGLDGAPHRLSEYRGRVVVVNFWATWCPPCRREMPSMERAWRRLHAQGAVLLAVNVGESPRTVSTFLTQMPVSFPVLIDESAGVMHDWSIPGLPTTFVIDPDGRIVYRAVGGRRWDAPEIIEAVLALQRPSGQLAHGGARR